MTTALTLVAVVFFLVGLIAVLLSPESLDSLPAIERDEDEGDR